MNGITSNNFEIPVPWGEIKGLTYGDTNGIPILAVHGWMNNAGSFERIAHFLDNKYYLVAIDLPGHGLSSHLPIGMPYEYTDYVLALKRTFDFFKWEKVIWLGHSLGAGLGSFYASIFPESVSKLIMLDLTKPMAPALKDNDKYKNYGEKVAAAIQNFLVIEETVKDDPPVYTYKEALKRLLAGTKDQFDEEAGKILLKRGLQKISENEDKWIFTRDLRASSAIINRASQDQMWDILSNIKCPILIVKAIGSSYFEPQEVCEKAIKIYKEKSKHFEMTFVEGNHYVHISDAATVCKEINRFLLLDI